jgi:hypothetical protein
MRQFYRLDFSNINTFLSLLLPTSSVRGDSQTDVRGQPLKRMQGDKYDAAGVGLDGDGFGLTEVNSGISMAGSLDPLPAEAGFTRKDRSASGVEPLDHPEKVGIGTWDFDAKGTALADLDRFNFSWYSNWQADPLWSPGGQGNDDERFVPMIWGGADVTRENRKSAQDATSGYLLGFNEPDNSSQADMSVQQAIKLWPLLMNTKLELGSPACTTSQTLGADSWLGRFMDQADKKGYDVDFIAVHYYTDTPSISDFRAFLKDVRQEYGRPVWVTEWALADWENPDRYSSEEHAEFASAAIRMMDDLNFVKRHAWFGAYEGGDGWDLNTHLLDAEGNMTAVGEAFQDLLL